MSVKTILRVEHSAHVEHARILFREYEAWLGFSLCFQGFEDELANLPGKYVSPDGRLLIAYVNGELAGCIAMRKLDDGICEMKRLFVRDRFRGQRIGVQLLERVIAEARDEGYRKMRLDTYPLKMGKAVDLYRSYGFVEIDAYYDNPHEDIIFMELSLVTFPNQNYHHTHSAAAD